MDAGLRILAAFILVDVLAAFALIGLVGLLRRRQRATERVSSGGLLGAALFLLLVSGFIYGGIWLLLQSNL